MDILIRLLFVYAICGVVACSGRFYCGMEQVDNMTKTEQMQKK